MKHLATILWLSALVLLCGCGGGSEQGIGGVGGAGGGGAGVIPTPAPPSVNIAGNWHFSMTSTVSGAPPTTIEGSINQSGNSIRGAVHIDGSNCFDRLTTVGLTGNLTGRNISLTSTSVGGQVITFTGGMTDSALSGTYTISGGCANDDQGDLSGIKILPITSTFSGTFTTSGGETFDVAGDLTQARTSSEGSFGLTGSVTFGTSCFSSGTITSGTFPSGSFIMGTSVALEIETVNGTVAFLGTLNPVGKISGDYTVFGGTCDQTGTGSLTSDPWGY
jgi:hypothetical protein